MESQRAFVSVVTLLFVLSAFVSPLAVVPVFYVPDGTGSRLVAKSPEIKKGSTSSAISGILDNASFVESVKSFLQGCQDDGTEIIPSMDIAYYLGSSLSYLSTFGFQDTTNLTEEIIDFTMSSLNVDGGFGNWKGARSSMESTYQAIQLLSIHGQLSALNASQANSTVNFIKGLWTPANGYLPLPNWDEPDVSSTYRAIYLLGLLKSEFPSLATSLDNSSVSFLNDTFVPPVFINGASGHSENIGGPAELLASVYAVKSFVLLNETSIPHDVAIAKYMDSLVATNGGVAGHLGGLPTTGFTASALQLYVLLKTKTTFDIDSYVSQTFVQDATNYIISNLLPGSGFAASDRDTTSEYSSSFFALRILHLLNQSGLLSVNPDLSGVGFYITAGEQPTFGIGDYPGSVPDISYSTDAILISKIIGDTSWYNPLVKKYIEDSYSPRSGGFGFRPSTTPRVKYTYYGVQALRTLNDPLVYASDIRLFLQDSQNIEGGFGEQPKSSLSYLTHSYWSVATLNQLGALPGPYIDVVSLKNWLSYLEKPDGTYSNYPGFNSTLTSTFRAIQILLTLGEVISDDNPLNATLSNFIVPSGGFLPSLDKAVPTMEGTFYGLSLAMALGFPINRSLVADFIMSLHNQDGGFAPRPGFSSRIESIFYAILALNLLETKENEISITMLGESPLDVYSPIIIPSFIPELENNKTIQNSYALKSIIIEPESAVNRTWVDLFWDSEDRETAIEMIFNGSLSESLPNQWSFILGVFDDSGYLRFRIHAIDTNNNSVSTGWYYLHTVSAVSGSSPPRFIGTAALLLTIVPAFILISMYDGMRILSKKRKARRGDVLLTVKAEPEIGLFGDEILNVVALFLIIGTVSVLARLFLQDAVLVLASSMFLFRFLLGMVVVLVVKYGLGLNTLGLFGPTILVIAMLLVGPLWGLVIFLNVFVFGYIIRMVLNPFNLAVGFRIGILMIFTVAFIGLLEMIGEIFLIPALSGSILVPILITPWFIDRYVVEAEQSDAWQSFYRLLVTLSVTTVSYAIMSLDEVVRILVVNPELWVVLVGVTFYFGRNTRYSRFDKQRFKRIFDSGTDPLSIQIRNRNYIARYNSKVLFPIINKFNIKEQFDKWRVPTPELLAVIENESQLPELMKRMSSEEQFKHGFVIKPSQSFGGKGILVVSERNDVGSFIIGSREYAPEAIEREIIKVLQGEFLTSQTYSDRDIVLIEEKVNAHPLLAGISTGLPDVRVIVFRGIPVMAMMRLSTEESQGKANLKQGAIGAAVRISDGRITRAEIKGAEFHQHPDTGGRIVGFRLPDWQAILATACLAQKSTGLGYAGVDIVIDENDRILVLEVNKRPGLEIQNVCQASLLERFARIEKENLDGTSRSAIGAALMGLELAKRFWEREDESVD
ncbi:MAG: sugar-transfer associated ATP-grasp domain-containing protein [Candidatus Thorarchaeota archaeon]